MKIVQDQVIDRIEAIVAEIEQLDPRGEFRQASDREPMEIIRRILRKRKALGDNWQQIGSVAKRIVDGIETI